jgi:hypothetical protein
MALVEGVISRINSTQFNGKNFYSFALNGQDGWYGTGIKRPPREGVSVRFEFKKNSKGYLEVDGPIEIRTDGEVGPAGGVSTQERSANGSSVGYAGNSSGSKKSPEERGYWDRKEQRDIKNDADRELGASRNTALNIIDLMIKHEAIKLPAVAKREEFLWTLLGKYIARLMAKEQKAEETATPESEPPTGTADENNEVWN